MRLFFYGTLCDPDVLRLILGYRPSPRQLDRAVLYGFRRKKAQNRTYPVLLAAPSGIVSGLLFRPRSGRDICRLNAYEGPEYLMRPRWVRPSATGRLIRAQAYLPAPRHLPATLQDWEPQHWRRRHKAAFLQSLIQQQDAGTPCANP